MNSLSLLYELLAKMVQLRIAESTLNIVHLQDFYFLEVHPDCWAKSFHFFFIAGLSLAPWLSHNMMTTSQVWGDVNENDPHRLFHLDFGP